MILYRPVGLQELELIYDGGMKAFPARLPQQPIFYPVLQLEYARQTASDWNTQNGQFAGYVTQFKVDDEYIGQFEEHTVGGSQHQELWIPAEEVDEFNKHIIGHIKVLEAYFGEAFQGFVPDSFGLQGKNAVEQFTLLANSYIYKRMEFFQEIRRNHKAVFLNYRFWQEHEFKNQGLKEKILQAIKEAWWTSFPQTPLPLPPPVQEDTAPPKQTDAQVQAQDVDDSVQGDILTEEEADAFAYAQRLDDSIREKFPPPRPTYADSLVEHPVQKDIPPVEQSDPFAQQVNPVPQAAVPPAQIDPHSVFVHGIKLGLSGRYHEAIAELSRAVEEDPDHVVAHSSLGVAFHRLAEDDRALVCYETALRLGPIYAEAHYFRANILYSNGNVREAITAYTLAIGLNPELIEAHQKALPQDRLTDYVPAPAEMNWIARPAHRILDLNRALEANPRQANLFKERAAEYYRLRNYAQAIADYSSSLTLQPDDANAFHLRGTAYEQLGQSERALEDYQRAIAINPQLSDGYIQRGINFGNIGNFRQSIASFSEAIRLAPGNPGGYFNRGSSYFQLGDLEKAVEDFSTVIRLSPGDETAYYWRGISHEEAGRPHEAIADYRQFLALSQDANARQEIEQRLTQWEQGKSDDHDITRDMLVAKLGRWVSRLGGVPDNRQKTEVPSPLGAPDQALDLYDLIAALGERALRSIWFGSGVECYGENADELYAFTEHNRQIEGGDFLYITSGIRQTTAGDFHAFDPGAASPWIFIRAWAGSGFYIETDDTQIEKLLKTHFPSVEEVEGASPPYAGLFLRI
jgi:tetratricopeptide (TPR) repeat protein